MGAYTGTWMQAAAGAAGSALGIGVQRLGANYDRNQQLKTQQGLTDIQAQAEKDLMEYQQQKQLEMWQKTSYSAQMNEMNKAGINPALLYGMSGGGSQTVGGTMPSVSGGTAQHVNSGAIGMQAGMQLALLASQKNVLDTQAEKNKAEATKISGTDTKESQTRIDSLMQGIDNARQQYEIQRLDITLKNIENYEKQSSQEDRLDYIEYQTKIAARQLTLATNEAQLSTETLDNKIKIVALETIGAALKNIQTKTQTTKTESDIQVNKEQLNQWIQNNMREWDKMSQENRKIAVMELMQQFNTDPVNHATNQISKIIDNIFLIQRPMKK